MNLPPVDRLIGSSFVTFKACIYIFFEKFCVTQYESIVFMGKPIKIPVWSYFNPRGEKATRKNKNK